MRASHIESHSQTTVDTAAIAPSNVPSLLNAEMFWMQSRGSVPCCLRQNERRYLIPWSDLRRSDRPVLDTDGDGNDHDRRHDTYETDPRHNADLVQGLDRGQSECPDGGNNDPHDGTSRMSRDGIEGDGNGDETGTRQENHEQWVGDGEGFLAPSTGEDVANGVHGIDLGMVALELTLEE